MAGMAMGKGMSGMPMAGAAAATPSKPMAMPAGADLSDLAYDSFLLNGRGNQEPWAGVARPGERVRLRLINAGSSTFFRVMIDGHPLTVVHADGIAVRPVEVDWLLIGMAETYDVLVDVAASGSFTIRAEAQDGSGQALGVLHTPDVAPRADLGQAELGPASARLWRSRRGAADRIAGGAVTRLCPRSHGRHGELRLVDQRPGLAERRPADGAARRAGRGDDDQPDGDVAPDAPARALLPSARHRRRTGPGAAQAHGFAAAQRQGSG